MKGNDVQSLSSPESDNAEPKTAHAVSIGAPINESVDRAPVEALLKDQINIEVERRSPLEDLIIVFARIGNTKRLRRILLLIGITFVVLILNVLGEIRMNRWQGAFFRAIEQKKLADVTQQSILFVCIMLVLLSFVVSQNWLLERLKIRVREWLTHHLLDAWMQPSQAYPLNMISEERLNPDQRIQEDIRHFSEMSGDLGMGATRSTFMLLSFVGVLWVMSNGITLDLFGRRMLIPGYMVWFAIIYAVLGSWLAIKVGRPLIKMNEHRYTQEANFRYSLVRISDNAESIGFYSGENDERKIVDTHFESVLDISRVLTFANARLTWIACGHGWMVVILPVLVALPGYLQGKIDFGGLMMVVGAFNQVQQSLRWFVENFARIADWRATLHRVATFQEAVLSTEQNESSDGSGGKIELAPNPEGFLSFEKTRVSLMSGQIVITDATAQVHPGERVLLVGESGSGKSTLLRAVGGLWPWGSGKILLPPRSEMMFLPQRPYIPLGTLAAALTYPNAARSKSHEEMSECLKRVNLEAFIPMLDENARWDKMMNLGQQQRLAFARLLVHRPKWIFLDEATSALDDQNQERVMSIFKRELCESAILSIGHRAGLEAYHNRTLHLAQTATGRVLQNRPDTQKQPPRLSRLQRVLRRLTYKRRFPASKYHRR